MGKYVALKKQTPLLVESRVPKINSQAYVSQRVNEIKARWNERRACDGRSCAVHHGLREPSFSGHERELFRPRELPARNL